MQRLLKRVADEALCSEERRERELWQWSRSFLFSIPSSSVSKSEWLHSPFGAGAQPDHTLPLGPRRSLLNSDPDWEDYLWQVSHYMPLPDNERIFVAGRLGSWVTCPMHNRGTKTERTVILLRDSNTQVSHCGYEVSALVDLKLNQGGEKGCSDTSVWVHASI